MTGTPLDLTPFGGLLQGIGLLYWLLALGLVGLALWKIRRPWLKYGVAAVLALGFAWPVLQHRARVSAQLDAAQARLKAATAHFEMRCQSAGEKIMRTVDNVEGIVWMKWRDKYDVKDDYDQFKLSDPYGRDCNGQACIEQLLRLEDTSGRFQRELAFYKGRYRFVESTDPAEGRRYRYRGVMRLPVPPWTQEAIEKHRRMHGEEVPDYSYRFGVDPTPIDDYASRYGVTWDDISTREDREHWIAGGSTKVIDLHTGEVIAERVGYMMDRELGNRDVGRSPWAMARRTACPTFPGGERSYPQKESVLFVMKVLKPSPEKRNGK